MLKEKNKNYKIKYVNCFWKEYYEILEYISDNLYYPTLKKFDNDVFNKINYLMYFPRMYIKFHKNPRYRRIVVGNYIIFYRIDDVNKIVNIVHIYHSQKGLFNLI